MYKNDLIDFPMPDSRSDCNDPKLLLNDLVFYIDNLPSLQRKRESGFIPFDCVDESMQYEACYLYMFAYSDPSLVYENLDVNILAGLVYKRGQSSGDDVICIDSDISGIFRSATIDTFRDAVSDYFMSAVYKSVSSDVYAYHGYSKGRNVLGEMFPDEIPF